VRRIGVVMLIAAAAACKREEPAPAALKPPTSITVPPSTTHAAVPPPARPKTSTPQQCAGDGSYEAALACYRMASHLKFGITDVNGLHITGEMRRPTPGAETVRFSGSEGDWEGITKPNGIAWTHNGKPERGSDMAMRLYQRLTIFPDPQKREGWPQRLDDGVDVNGVPCNRYHFTDANNGAVYDVWVSTTIGDVARVRIGTWMMDVSR
jgi:hypothetical protein